MSVLEPHTFYLGDELGEEGGNLWQRHGQKKKYSGKNKLRAREGDEMLTMLLLLQ